MIQFGWLSGDLAESSYVTVWNTFFPSIQAPPTQPMLCPIPPDPLSAHSNSTHSMATASPLGCGDDNITWPALHHLSNPQFPSLFTHTHTHTWTHARTHTHTHTHTHTYIHTYLVSQGQELLSMSDTCLCHMICTVSSAGSNIFLSFSLPLLKSVSPWTHSNIFIMSKYGHCAHRVPSVSLLSWLSKSITSSFIKYFLTHFCTHFVPGLIHTFSKGFVHGIPIFFLSRIQETWCDWQMITWYRNTWHTVVYYGEGSQCVNSVKINK